MLFRSTWQKESKYCTLFQPNASNVEKNGKGFVVASVGELSGSIPYTCFVTKGSYLQKHGDVAEKFLTAVIKARNFMKDEKNLDQVATALLPSFAGSTLDDMKAAVVAYNAIDAWSEDMILSPESFENLMKVMLNAKVITEKADWAKCVNNTLAEKIKTQLAA